MKKETLDHRSAEAPWNFRRPWVLVGGLVLGFLVLVAATAQWKQHRHDAERDAIARACGVASDRLSGPEVARRNGREMHVFRADIAGLNAAGTVAWGEIDVESGRVDCEVR